MHILKIALEPAVHPLLHTFVLLRRRAADLLVLAPVPDLYFRPMAFLFPAFLRLGGIFDLANHLQLEPFDEIDPLL